MVIVRATELNNKNIYALQIGANLCYKLGQLHYYKLGQALLKIGVAITNQGNRYYKIGQLLQLGQNILQIGEDITSYGNYYKLGHNSIK